MSTLFFHFDGTDNDPDDAFAPANSLYSITTYSNPTYYLAHNPTTAVSTTPASAPMAAGSSNALMPPSPSKPAT